MKHICAFFLVSELASYILGRHSLTLFDLLTGDRKRTEVGWHQYPGYGEEQEGVH